MGQKKTRVVEQGNQRLAKEVHPTWFLCWSTTLDGPTSAIMWKMGRYQHPGSHYFLAVIYIINDIIVIIVPMTRLDKLAAQGVQLKSHYVQPTCTPSRYKFCSSLFTSMQWLLFNHKHYRHQSCPDDWTLCSKHRLAKVHIQESKIFHIKLRACASGKLCTGNSKPL